jgi:hypothetical protein
MQTIMLDLMKQDGTGKTRQDNTTQKDFANTRQHNTSKTKTQPIDLWIEISARCHAMP